jgi:hypothetical protein
MAENFFCRQAILMTWEKVFLAKFCPFWQKHYANNTIFLSFSLFCQKKYSYMPFYDINANWFNPMHCAFAKTKDFSAI